MAQDQRRSSRAVKINKNPDFVYDSESDFLQDRKEIWHSSLGGAEGDSTKTSIEYIGKDNELQWTDLYDLPLLKSKLAKDNQCLFSGSPALSQGSSSQSHEHHSDAAQLLVAGAHIVYSSDDSELSEERYRLNSSTRLDYLEFEDCFLSMSPTLHTDSSEMGEPNKGVLCACNSGILDIECCSGASKSKAETPADDRTML